MFGQNFYRITSRNKRLFGKQKRVYREKTFTAIREGYYPLGTELLFQNASPAFEFVFRLTNRRKWFFKKFFVLYLYFLWVNDKNETDGEKIRFAKRVIKCHLGLRVARHTTHRRRLLFFTVFNVRRGFFFRFQEVRFALA